VKFNAYAADSPALKKFNTYVHKQLCCNKSDGVDVDGGEGATLTAEHLAEDSQDGDSEVE